MVLDLLAAAALAVQPVDAPGDDEPTDGDIIVTGERVPRTIRETPSSVVALNADAIEATGSDRLDHILEMIPNVQIGSGEEGPAIRGQDSTGVLRNLFAFLGGTRPRVTVQIDGRPVTYYEYVASSAPLWDLNRIEVWRSPQTTTQGRNSIAGAIFIETADPTFAWEGRARGIVGELGTRQVSALVSGPIVADRLAVRVSGDLHLGRMASDMADAIPGADIRRDDYGIARVKLLLTPALPGARIETSYVHTVSQSPQFEAVLPPYRNRAAPVPQQTNGIHRVNVDSLTARWHQEAGAVTAYTTLSFGDTQVRRFGLPGLGATTVDSQDYSKETIVRWHPDGGALSVLGGFNQVTTRQIQTIDITGLGIGAGGFRDRQTSLGLFGELTWQPVNAVAVTAGLRHQWDTQRRIGQVGPVPGGGIALDYDGRFQAWLGKLSLAWDVSDATTAGVLVQRAYTPGGTSFNIVRRTQDSFDEERVWSGEAFVRTRFDGGRGTIALNLFHNAITDAQRTQDAEIIIPGQSPFFFPEIGNAPRARTQGLEVEAGYRAGSRLSLRAALGLLRTKVLETVFPTDATLGKEFQRSPHLSASAAIDWRPVDGLRLSATARHHGGYFSDDTNDPARRIDPATIVDLRGEYGIGPVSLFGYVRNAFDTFYLTYNFGSRAGTNLPALATAGDPREAGIGVEARF